MTVPMENGVHPSSKKMDKKKKAKKVVPVDDMAVDAEEGAEATAAASEPASAVTADEPKLSKKERKRQRAATAEAATAAATVATAGAEVEPAAAALNGQAAEAVAEDGQKKKKKKAAKEAPVVEAAAADETRQPETVAAAGEKKKKAKGGTAGGAGGDGGVALHAAVGDAELARRGKAIVKALYQMHPDTARLTEEQVADLRAERAIAVEGSDLAPLTSFSATSLPPDMLHSTRSFQQPSPIQAQAWPLVLSGHDLIAIAATGSGKTLGFGLPMMRHIVVQKEAGVVRGKGPFALVMAPTRELACQIAEVLEDAGSQCGVRCVCVYGGVSKKDQLSALRRGVEVVVGTPGRLEDLMNEGACQLSEVTYLVLDEADRMLDLGFEPHIRSMCGQIRSDRQTLMFSATWPDAVKKLAANFLNSRPVRVTIGSAALAASHSIKQVVEVLDPRDRDTRLLELMQQYHKSRKNRVLIFVLYKKEAPRVEQLLTRKGWIAASIHGDISQNQRTAAVENFKSGKVPLLIATDVAARGLDIPDVEVVINYSFPLTTEDYVHRIGRTGRAGKTGVAHTFFCAANDKPRSGELINVLKEAKQPVPESLLAFGTAVKKKESSMYGAHFKDVEFGVKATKVTFDDDDE